MFNPKHWDYDPKPTVKAGLEGPKKKFNIPKKNENLNESKEEKGK